MASVGTLRTCGAPAPITLGVRPPSNMRALESLEYESVWDEFDRRFTFRPSVKTFPGINEPSDSITFRFVESDDESMVDELQISIFRALRACNAFAHEVYYLDWQHECYQIEEPIKDNVWANGFPDGDYAVFLANEMSIGSFGHPWEYSICLFGESFVKHVIQQKPRILGAVLRNRALLKTSH